MSDKTLGFIGLGMMGGPMALNLLKSGYDLALLDTSEAALAPVLEAGGRRCANPAEVASQAETVLVSLPTPDVVRTVALGADGLVEGTAIKTYVDLSTTGPIMAQTVAEGLNAKGIQCLDAPVSGGERGAGAGTLAIMVSGPKAAYEALLPVLETIGRKLFYVGAGAGMGQTVKVANNYLSATNTLAASEALVMGVKAGIDPDTMLDVINASSGRSRATEDNYPRYVLPRDFTTGFKQRLLHKDVRLCMEEAAALDVPMWLGNTVLQFLTYALSQGTGDEVSISLVKHVERWAGVEVSKAE
jgi:3-hydroxyisobutyrate dehydrogenase-like beta-hydroxyacid dehydrogenase